MSDLKPHLIFLTRSFSFPNGMAATQRVSLLARGLVESGIDVSILCTQVTERLPIIENRETIGIHDSIHFEYTTGTTIRSNHFLARRWHEIRGIWVAIRRLIEFKWCHNFCFVYYYGSNMVNEPVQWLFFAVMQLLKLPYFIEFCERPWTMTQDGNQLENSLSPVWGAQGVVVISAFLNHWAEQEMARIKRDIAILEVPILVDMNETQLTNYPHGSLNVLFAGSPAYDQTIQFILDAMKMVWVSYPQCKLVITGCHPGDLANKEITQISQDQNFGSRIELAGYLPRRKLLLKYANANALLIPLFDDVRSKARFPTKFGEYLASGRPVVTNSVGEAARFFVDKKSVYMCAPGDAASYAEKIMEVLDNLEEANEIGLAGRIIAEKNFHYSIHARRVVDFIFKNLA